MDNVKQLVDEFFAEPENKEKFNKCIQRAILSVMEDVSIRIPRTESERQNEFEHWLAAYREKLGPAMEEAFRIEFPSLYKHKQLRPQTIRQTVEEHLWPLIEDELRSYAIRGVASAWVSKHMGDATTIGLPQREGSYWRVPLGVNKYGENLGQVVLDADGNVITDLTTTRKQLLEVIHDREFPARKSATGQ
ncbi:MAG TPA: hypothetical protein VFA07_17225 [Chthonomonadaceae bacterium]|nr:hypothetical protein [Chthonomonadaceae bacterium]